MLARPKRREAVEKRMAYVEAGISPESYYISDFSLIDLSSKRDRKCKKYEFI
jgi:hypothetical protein